MGEYAKPWLTIAEQIDRLEARGVDVGSRAVAAACLAKVGYYRLSGYLYPSRCCETYSDGGRKRTRVLSDYRPGTSIAYAVKVIDYDRALRMLVLDAVERIEVSLRMRIGHTLGARSAFAHRDRASFVPTFTESRSDRVTGEPISSKHGEWLERVQERQDGSDESFVAHFRERYEGILPIWVLTELLELGHLGRLYGGLQNDLATAIAAVYSTPSKKMLGSWIASINYVRNVAAHHARLFNRKLVVAPSRPRTGQIPLLDHLHATRGAKADFGVYNALAVMAYLLRAIDPRCDWNRRVADHPRAFPTGALTVADMGAPAAWFEHALWHSS